MVQISRAKSDYNIATLEPLEIPYSRQDAQVPPLVIFFPSQFTFESTKEVTWNYKAIIYVDDKSLILEHAIRNIEGIGGMNHSGKVFTPE